MCSLNNKLKNVLLVHMSFPHTSVLHDPYVGSPTQLRVLRSTSQLGMSEPGRGCPAVEQA